ncbi:hypothetical protein PO124_26375 [Bacillus licheniformis]|nr:hypothetical protein [Bacillus licheniformis]
MMAAAKSMGTARINNSNSTGLTTGQKMTTNQGLRVSEDEHSLKQACAVRR